MSRSLPTLTKGTEMYSYQKDVLLSGESHVRLAGWPQRWCPREIFSDGDLRSLAGDSFSVPVAAVIQCAFYMNHMHRGGSRNLTA